MSQTFRRYIPMALSAAVGFITIITYFFYFPLVIQNASSALVSWGSILTAFAQGLGTIFLLRSHARRVIRRDQGEWIYSLVIIISTFIFPVLFFTHGDTSTLYKTLYQTINNNIGAGVWGILIFALTGAVYRAFRLQNLNSTFLLVSCLIVMLQIAPVGGVIWSGFPILGNWIMDIPTTGGYRGIMVTAAFGLIALGFRTLFGYEKGYLGGEE